MSEGSESSKKVPEPYLTWRGFLVYPEGRITNQNVDGYSSPNEEVNSIMDESLMLLVPESFDHKLKVIDLARRLFVNLDFFLYTNLVENKQITQTGLEFIVDTINFIATGQRKMLPLVWGSVMPSYYSHTHMVTREQRRKILDTMNQEQLSKLRPRDVSSDDCIECDEHWERVKQWIAQPGGFDDLTTTLRVIFGGPLSH